MSSETLQFSNFLIAAILCLLFAFLKSLWPKRHHRSFKIEGPLVLPLIGSAYVFFGNTQNIFETFLNLGQRYGHLYKIWFGDQLFFVVSNPDDVKTILNNALERTPGYRFLVPVFGNGLFTLPVGEWKRHRKLISATFNRQILNSFVATFANYSNILVEKLEESLEKNWVDVFPILTQCTVDIITDTTMGVELDIMKKNGHHLIPWTERLSQLGILRMVNPLLQKDFIWNRLSKSKETKILSEKVNDYIRTIVNTKRAERSPQTEAQSPRRIFLDHLFELEDTEGTWDREKSVQESLTILVAGSDAPALVTGYVLMMLGMHQEIQARTHQELVSIFGTSKRDVTVEDLQELSYLERVIKETLRIFPVASVIGRHLVEDIVLSDIHTLPRGSSVYIPVICIHRDPELWPEPLKFDPDRFLVEEAAKRHPYSYIPFSGGPRNCLGFRYAMMAMKAILATVLRRYKITTKYKLVQDIKLKVDVSTKCVEGQKVHFEKRRHQ